MMTSPFLMSGLGLIISSFVMTLAWAFARHKNFFSLVDAVWAIGIGFLAALYLLFTFLTTAHWTFPNFVALGLVAAWSIRLGSHLARRLYRHFPNEDRRYVQLRTQWKQNLAFQMFVFFQFQALTQAFFAFPFAALAIHPPALSSFVFWFGAALSVFGLIGEATADHQLRQFSSIPSNRTLVCNLGLWRYSRHPNYFFECVIWCGFGICGYSAQAGWISAVCSAACPIAMFGLIFFVTGIPPAEASSLRSRGKLYEDYQNSTSKFFPWFQKPAPQRSKTKPFQD